MKLTVTKQFQHFFKSNNISLDELLQKANLPNTLWKEELNLSPLEYCCFLQELDEVITDQQLLAFSEIRNINMFMPAFFAALCAKNGLEALKRFATYKKLIGPLTLSIEESKQSVSIHYSFIYPDQVLPRFSILNEQLLLISLLRMGSGKVVIPEYIASPYHYGETIETYIGIKGTSSKTNQLIFRMADLQLPFITQNNAMWEYLEPEFKSRLTQNLSHESFVSIIQGALYAAIPSGKFTLKDIATSLGISVRTLQRNLSAEHTTFNQQLQTVQKLLAFNYLKNNTLSITEIAYLVGYQDTASFSRAFKKWTGKTITTYRKSL